MSVTKKVNSRKRTSRGTGTRVGGWGLMNDVANAIQKSPWVTIVPSLVGAASGGKSRKSSKKSLRRKSLVHKKKRCPKYCRRKSVRCKSYRPVRKSRKHR